MGRPDFLSPRNLSSFKRFELIAHSVVEGFSSGFHKSPYKGFAIEFAEHRPYSSGDDLKHLDWKLLAREDRYYIKQYEEDTELSSYLLLDKSGSMGYKSGEFSKLDYGKFICGVFSYILCSQGDSVGLLTFDSDIVKYIPAKSSVKHMKLIIDTLKSTTSSDETGMGNVLHSLANRMKRRALIVIVSDFFDDIKDISLAMNHFAHKKHEVVVFHVLDRQEEEFSFRDLTRFESMEGDHFVVTDPIRLREEYRKNFNRHRDEVKKVCHRLRIDYVPMFTDLTFEKSMAKYLAGRSK